MGGITSNRKSIWYFHLAFIVGAFLVVLPMLFKGILVTQSNDLENHVRHVYEYKLALLEGQRPPLVSPALNDNIRIPLFQYYTGTAYTLPGFISLTGMNEYVALKIAIFILSLLAAIAIFRALYIIIGESSAAFVGALTLQLFNFSFVDLYARGGYVEWVALQYAAIVFYSLIALMNSIKISEKLTKQFIHFLIAVIAMAFFIPCHPTHTFYTGLVILILVLVYLNDKNKFMGKRVFILGVMGTAFLLSLLLTSWFWLPILKDYRELKIITHVVFLSAGTDLSTVLWPWFYADKIYSSKWAPQLGVHITLSVFLLFYLWRKIDSFSKAVVILSMCLFLIVIAPAYTQWDILKLLFSPMQWSYRFLIPLAIVGAVLVGIAQHKLNIIAEPYVKRGIVVGVCACVVIVTAIPYVVSSIFFSEYSKNSPEIVRDASFRAPNSSGSYTLVGTNVLELRWIKEGKLQLNTDIELPREGIPFEVELTLLGRPHVTVLINGKPIQIISKRVNKNTVVQFTLQPSVGYSVPQQYIQFRSSADSVTVRGSKFRPRGDKEWLSVPASYKILEKVQGQKAGFYATVYADRAGLYQLPISYYPGIEVYINNALAPHLSHDQMLLVTKLRAGENSIYIQTTVSPLEKRLMWIAFLCLLVLFLYSVSRTRRLD